MSNRDINIILSDITFSFFLNYLLLVNGSFDIHPCSLFLFQFFILRTVFIDYLFHYLFWPVCLSVSQSISMFRDISQAFYMSILLCLKSVLEKKSNF